MNNTCLSVWVTKFWKKKFCIKRTNVLKFGVAKLNLNVIFVEFFIPFVSIQHKNYHCFHYVLKHKIYAVFRARIPTGSHKFSQCCSWLVGLILCHIKVFRLFNTKSIFMQIISSVSHYTGSLAKRVEYSPMVWETWVQSQVVSYQRHGT